MRSLVCAVAVLALVPCAAVAAPAPGDWPMFNREPGRSGVSDLPVGGITPDNVAGLERRQVELPGTVDSAPVYLADVEAGGRRGGALFMTTTYGRTLAVDPADGRILWVFSPPSATALGGTYRITQATPVASADRRWIYASSPDGRVHKLAVADGREAPGRWPVSITRLPQREKITASFNLSRGLLVVTTGGYGGDEPPYQGHVVTIDPGSGRIRGVFNSLCSDRHAIIVPRTCRESGGAIWARAGAVALPDGTLLVTTGDGRFDGRRHWGDSVLRLSSDARRLLGSYTPADYRRLEVDDLDMGSTSPALIGGGAFAQGGKDLKLRVLLLRRLARAGRTGGERQLLGTPGQRTIFSAPAVWRTGGETLVFVTTFVGTVAYRQSGGRLVELWKNDTGASSPVVAGGLLYAYDPHGTGLSVYRPRTGELLARLPAGNGHWNSPIPAGNVIALPQGDGNAHNVSGILNLYGLPQAP